MNFNSVILKTALITLCISHGPMKAMERTNDSNGSFSTKAAALKMLKTITSDQEFQERLTRALSPHHTIERPQFSPAELEKLRKAALESPNPQASPATAVWVAACQSNSPPPYTISFGGERNWYDSPEHTGTGSVADSLNSLSLTHQANQPYVHLSFFVTPPPSFTSHSARNDARKESGQDGQVRRKAKTSDQKD